MTHVVELKPLPHQIQTMDNLDSQFKQDKNRALVVLPSGSGKTHTVAFHVAKLKPKTFLYVVHRDTILTQTVKIFKKVCELEDDQIGIVNKKTKQYDKPYLFATVQSLVSRDNMRNIRREVDYMVIDEYHHCASDSYKSVLNHFIPSKLVGLSATPYRLDNKDIMKYVDNNIANEIDLFDAIRKNMVVPFHYMGLYDNIDYSKIKYNGFNYYVSDLDKKLIIHKRDEAVIDIYKNHIQSQKRLTIVFCNSIAHVNRLVKKMNGQDIRAIGITHKESTETRQQSILDFRKGKYEILCTRDILNEGVDFPECEAVMFLRPTVSKTVFLQQLGRGLRKMKGKTNVLVLDFIGNYNKAFEKREWFGQIGGNSGSDGKDFKTFESDRTLKPNFEYNPPNTVIEFDKMVVDIMDMQKRMQESSGHRVTKQDVLEDYLNCCKQHNKELLNLPEYEASPHRKYGTVTLKRLYDGSFLKFLEDNHIGDKRYVPPSFHNCSDETELIDNFFSVRDWWLREVVEKSSKSKIITPRNQPHPPKTYFSIYKYSKYHIDCYEQKYGSYENFLEHLNNLNLIAPSPPLIRDKKTIKAIETLQTKLGRQYFTLTDWIREYKLKGRPNIKRAGGFAAFKKLYDVPNQEVLCLMCKKRFERDRYYDSLPLCSKQCKNKFNRTSKSSGFGL